MTSMLCAALAAITVYVSPEGDDAKTGTVAEPVRTLERARDVLRQKRAADVPAFAAGGAEVVLADGVYVLSAPLQLTAADGGTAAAPVVWRAAHRGKALLSGGIVLKDWKPASNHVSVAELPAGLKIPGFTNGGCGTPAPLCEASISVFCGDKRLPQAQWPNEGYVRTCENVGTAQKSHDSAYCCTGVFKFPSDRLAAWAHEPDLWAYGLWNYEWADATVRVKGVDAAAQTLSVDPAPIGFGIRAGAQFRILNAVSEIDRPGEWALDRAGRRLHCWLPEGATQVTLAWAEGLVKAKGVENLHFADLAFAYARKTAIVLGNAKNCSVSGSTIRHTSSWGVVVGGGSSNRVEGCDLDDLGEGGIKLDGGDYGTLTPCNHMADNNHIHHFGEIVPNYRPGIGLGGVGARATHNLIHHTRHQAISFNGNDHYIGYNVCHDCCTFNDDAGTIYSCQRDWYRRGTVIEHNVVHMTGKQPRGTHTEGVYLDDYSSGVIVRYNVINRASLGVYVGGGQDCQVYGNLLVNCTRGLNLGSRGVETFARPTSIQGFDSPMFKSLRNVLAHYDANLYRRRYPNMTRVLDFKDGQEAHNAHFNVMTNNVLVGCRGIEKANWAKVAATCCVTDNVETATDPGFEDYAAFGWSFKPGSELARRLADVHFEKMGLYPSAKRASAAVKFGAGVTPPRPFGEEYDLATVRVDLPFAGALATNVAKCATNLDGCDVPGWGRGKRVVASFGMASLEKWETFRFSFTPTTTGPFMVDLMGARGEKTLYDDFRVTGATLLDGGFETGKGWYVPKEINKKDYRLPVCNARRPWGVVDEKEAGIPAAEGTKMWCGSDLINASQRLQCTAGVPVTFTFKARAALIDQ